jgi:excisionase family DNA binding protein
MQAKTITVTQASELLGVSRNAAYQAARAGEIPVIRIGRRLLVPRVALGRMLEGAGQKPREPEAA